MFQIVGVDVGPPASRAARARTRTRAAAAAAPPRRPRLTRPARARPPIAAAAGPEELVPVLLDVNASPSLRVMYETEVAPNHFEVLRSSTSASSGPSSRTRRIMLRRREPPPGEEAGEEAAEEDDADSVDADETGVRFEPCSTPSRSSRSRRSRARDDARAEGAGAGGDDDAQGGAQRAPRPLRAAADPLGLRAPPDAALDVLVARRARGRVRARDPLRPARMVFETLGLPRGRAHGLGYGFVRSTPRPFLLGLGCRPPTSTASRALRPRRRRGLLFDEVEKFALDRSNAALQMLESRMLPRQCSAPSPSCGCGPRPSSSSCANRLTALDAAIAPPAASTIKSSALLLPAARAGASASRTRARARGQLPAALRWQPCLIRRGDAAVDRSSAHVRQVVQRDERLAADASAQLVRGAALDGDGLDALLHRVRARPSTSRGWFGRLGR